MNQCRIKSKVFISHASTDLWVAKQLESEVKKCGADTFIDTDGVEYGDEFENVIIEQANDCNELLVLFTPIASERKYVWLEIGMFLGAKKRIVAALYGVSKEEIAKDQHTPLLMKKISSVNLNDIDGYFSQLKKRVHAEDNEYEQI